MTSMRDLRSYFSINEDVIQDSRISIQEIISSAFDEVSQAEVDIAKAEAKKQEAKRNNYQHILEQVRKEVGKYALVNGTIAIDRYSKIYSK